MYYGRDAKKAEIGVTIDDAMFTIANMNGSSGRQRISGKILELYKMPIPNEKIMNKFGEIITSFMGQIKKDVKENQTLIKTRDTLLPKLMSGEVRV